MGGEILKKRGVAPIVYIFRGIAIVIGVILLIQGVNGLGAISDPGDISAWSGELIRAIFGFGLAIAGISPRSLVVIFQTGV